MPTLAQVGALISAALVALGLFIVIIGCTAGGIAVFRSFIPGSGGDHSSPTKKSTLSGDTSDARHQR